MSRQDVLGIILPAVASLPAIGICVFRMQASSSIGRAAVSKTAGWGFDSLLACQFDEAIDN